MTRAPWGQICSLDESSDCALLSCRFSRCDLRPPSGQRRSPAGAGFGRGCPSVGGVALRDESTEVGAVPPVLLALRAPARRGGAKRPKLWRPQAAFSLWSVGLG